MHLHKRAYCLAFDAALAPCAPFAVMDNTVCAWVAPRRRCTEQSSVMLEPFLQQRVHTVVFVASRRKQFKEFLDVVEGLTEKDITGLMQKLFKTPLTLATMGDVSKVPRYDLVAKRFK